MRLKFGFCLLVIAGATLPSSAAEISKSYTYFSLYGKTAEDLDREMAKRGPKLESTHARHPGATSMAFGLKTKISNDGKYCRIEKAYVTLTLKVVLPSWKNRNTASQDMAIMWDTLSSDIKRHEERHAIIARNYAMELENALEALPRSRDCKALQDSAAKKADAILSAHSAAQAQFDKVESINFEARLTRLLAYRLEQLQARQLAKPAG